MTLKQWLSDWITLRTDLKPRTIESYTDLLTRYIVPALGAADVETLSPVEITHFLAEVVRTGRTRTAELLYVFLKAAFRDFPGDVNPLHRVRRPTHRQKSPEPWTDDQMAIYLAALEGHRQQLPLSLAIMLGLRRGEICGLRWEDVDFDRNVIRVCNQRQRLATGEIIDCTPKSESSIRTLPIPLALSAPLRRSRQLSGYVCSITPSGLDQAHKRLCARLELPPIPLHGLRHTMATSCIRHGGDMRSLQSLLGHSSYATTANRYTHPDQEMLRKALDFANTPCYTVLQS